ncbi:MAG TPA: DUF3120 domain-containing protein [Trichocoleus sp.]
MLSMFNLILRIALSLSSPSNGLVTASLKWLNLQDRLNSLHQPLKVLFAAVGLVALPVFFQAPLVRVFPWVSLVLTALWLGLGLYLMRQPRWQLWGDLLVGFTWTWLAGSLYWGWLRWEPLVHLPVEALGLPIVAVCLWLGWGRVGSYFYLGSLLGTAVTDLYTNWMDLFPAWRQLMAVDPEFIPVVLRAAASSLQTEVAGGRALLLVVFLLVVGVVPLLSSRQLAWWAFGGAVLSTLVVDGLFFLSASLA